MPKRKDLKKILVVGAGPIIIGQACEFDYSGTQACKALRNEGYKVVLINSNPATIMTDPDVADKTYIEPITLNVLEKILKKEKPDAILPTMGGQTALNLAIEPDIFVQSTVNRASKILSENKSKEEKIEELKLIAKDTVDIRGIGFYTLGATRKNLSDTDKSLYLEIFEKYFLKSFSSRLAEYTNPEIDVYGKEMINKNYTIVNSLLKATKERPEIKIDWRIYTKDPNQPLIRDLIIEGLSLARTQKEEFASVLNSNDGNIKVLFQTLEEFYNKE